MSLPLNLLLLGIPSPGWTAPQPVKRAPAPTPKKSPYIATGVRFGVVSLSPTANTIASQYLEQGGTVWDATAAVLFQLMVDAPHVAAFDSDVVLAYVAKNQKPAFYWLSNSEAAQESGPSVVFPYSRWTQKLAMLHKTFSKFPLMRIMALPIARAEAGASAPAEFAKEIATLSHIPAIRLISLSKSKPKLAQWLTHISQGQFLLANVQLAITQKQSLFPKMSATKIRWGTPPTRDTIFQRHITLNSHMLYGLVRKDLATLERAYAKKTLSRHPKSQTIREVGAHSPYFATFGMVLFDSYGNLIALQMGIPDLANSRFDPWTETLAHAQYANIESRQSALSPYVLHHTKSGIRWAIAPHISNTSEFLKTLSPLLIQNLQGQQPLFQLIPNAPPIPWLGIEVQPAHSVGFTSPWRSVLPLMY